MSEFKFQGQKFIMEHSAKDFIEKYIGRIKKYVESHNISDGLLEDIYQSILEKLFEIKGDITQKQLVSIVNSIGEPEDIFEDINSQEKDLELERENKYDIKPYEKRQKTKRTRPRDNSILLGVCAMFGQATIVPTRIWRGLTILGSWFFLETNIAGFYFGWAVYLILALIFPIKGKDYKHCSMLIYRGTQVRDLRLIIPNFFSWIWNLCKGVKKIVIPSIIKLIKNMTGPIWIIVKYIFLICWSLLLFGITIFLGAFAYCSFTQIAIGNIDYSVLLPAITKYGAIFGVISTFILLLASIGSIFKKRLSNNTSLVIAIGGGIVAIIIAIISLFAIGESIVNILGTKGEETAKEVEIEIPNKDKKLELFIKKSDYSILENLLIQEPRFVNLFPSDNDKLKVVYTFTFRRLNEEYTSQAMENLSDIGYGRGGDGLLMIGLENNNIFQKVTPAIPLNISIDIYVPKSLSIQLKNIGYTSDETLTPFRAKERGMHGYHDCDSIKYNEETEKFDCTMAMNYRDRYNIAMKNLQELADMIVPLQGKNSARSRSHNRGEAVEQYWFLDSINIRNESKLLAKYSDNFFNFFIIVDYAINSKTGEFTLINSIIQEIEQKGLMDNNRIKKYEGRDKIKDYEVQMKENEDKIKMDLEEMNKRIDRIEKTVTSLTESL